MANTLMNRARQGFANKEIDWDTDTIKCVATDSDYTFSAAHEDLADIPAGGRVATTTLTSPTLADGVLDAADAVFSTVSAGSTITGFMIYQDTGTEATSLLIYWMDTDSGGSPISVATDGTDVTVQFNASGIVKI